MPEWVNPFLFVLLLKVESLLSKNVLMATDSELKWM
jgi:hypothetical protein